MRCARLPTLPFSNNTWNLVIAAGFVVGLLLFVVSSAMLRSHRREAEPQAAPAREAPAHAWPKLVDESLEYADAELRLDMIDRLSVVPGDWSRGILEQARLEETDPAIRAAIDRALGVPG
jgi:hypothetical protein